jgi:hypothetical protein
MRSTFLFAFALSFAPLAHAEPKPLPNGLIEDPTSLPEPVKAEARKRSAAGREAMAAGKFELAYQEFRRAYAIAPSVGTLGNVGLAALETERYVDAAVHLRQVVRLERQRAHEAPAFVLAAYERALQKVGRVRIVANEPGVRVLLDGNILDERDGEEEQFAMPGERRVRVEKDGYEPFETSVAVRPGAVSTVHATLGPVERIPEAPGTAAAEPRPAPPRRASAAPVARASGPTGTAKTIVVLSGAALTAAAGALTLVYAVKASDASEAVESETRQAENLGSIHACHRSGCAPLDAALERRQSAERGANIAFGATLLLGLATTAAFVFLPSPDGDRAQATPRARVLVGRRSLALEVSLP